MIYSTTSGFFFFFTNGQNPIGCAKGYGVRAAVYGLHYHLHMLISRLHLPSTHVEFSFLQYFFIEILFVMRNLHMIYRII